MQIRVIAFVIGWVLKIEAALLLLPLFCALIYKESIKAYIWTIILCLIIGVICTLKKPRSEQFRVKEGFAATALAWIVLSLTGMLPFMFDGSIPSAVDAFFETVSGFTTTGASILTDVEALPHGLLFWRSFMHWIGGMGILVFMLAIVPMAGGTQMNLMRAESPGPTISKFVPRAQGTAKLLYGLYIGLTIITIAALIISRMPVFDSVCIAFGAAGTGGFSILNDGCASYTILQQNIITVAVIMFGVNFAFYYLIVFKHFKEAFGIEEVRWYLSIILISIILISTSLVSYGVYDEVLPAVQTSAFHVGSIITTTGYATEDINVWPAPAQGILVLLMFCGACAGSTGGGLKVSRILLMFRSYKRELSQMLRPGMVKSVHMDGKVVDESVLKGTANYFFIYMVIFAASALILSLDKTDWVTNVTAVAATFNNIGPGLGAVGTVGNYSCFSDLSKLILSADMLIGRLEIFPIMLLFSRSAWKKF